MKSDDRADDRGLLPQLETSTAQEGFSIAMRGYDKRQVHEALAQWEQVFSESEERRIAAEQALSEAQVALRAAQTEASTDPKQDPAEAPSYASLGQRVAAILTLAEEEAHALRGQAATEADAIRSSAHRDVEQALRSARSTEQTSTREAEQRVQIAEREARNIEASATNEATRRVSDAKRQAERILAEAREGAVNERRRASQELTSLQRQRDQVVGQLDTLHRTLASAMAPLGGAGTPEQADSASRPSVSAPAPDVLRLESDAESGGAREIVLEQPGAHAGSVRQGAR